mgnify:CR=1 FL=1
MERSCANTKINYEFRQRDGYINNENYPKVGRRSRYDEIKNKNDKTINKKIDIENDTDLKSQDKNSLKTKELNKKKTRESFRAKAVDFSKKEKVFKNKTFEIKDVSPKEEEKRNGWWNQ